MSRRAYVAGAAVLVVLALTVMALTVFPTGDSTTPADTVSTAQTERDSAAEAAENGEETGQVDEGENSSAPEETKPATGFEELDFDETTTSPDLVEAAVCDLSGRLFGVESPNYKDSGEFRDLIVISEEKLADYRLAEEIDPRINSALNIADRVVENWNLALYSYEAGDGAAAKKYMARADLQTKRVHKVGTGDLCPTN